MVKSESERETLEGNLRREQSESHHDMEGG
jgi:hypothetical protein